MNGTLIMVEVRSYDGVRNWIQSAKSVSILTDDNVWIPTYNSWYYQFPIRWITGTVFIMSGLTAGIFLLQHFVVLHDKFVLRNSHGSFWNFCKSRMSFIIMALVIEFIYAPVIGFMVIIGGFGSTGNLPDFCVRFFTTYLSGLSFVTTLLSAAVWNRMLLKVQSSKHQSLFSRILNGKYPLVSIILYTYPVFVDGVITGLYVFRIIITPSIESSFIAGTYSLIQFVIGLYFFISAMKFQKEIKIRSQFVSKNNNDVAETAERMSFVAIGISISMLLYCIGCALMAFTKFWLTPFGWTLAWGIASIGHCFQSLFHVAMFRPRPRQKDNGVSGMNSKITTRFQSKRVASSVDASRQQ